jgi:hypothetical protein
MAAPIRLVLAALVLALGAGAAVSCVSKTDSESPKSRTESADAAPSQRMTGDPLAEWEAGGSFLVQWEGGPSPRVTECRWSKEGGSQYRHYDVFPDRPPPDWSPPQPLSKEAEAALRSALTIIVRDKLWEQGDVRTPKPFPDMGGVTYEFSVGPHHGRFSLIGTPDVPQLRLFVESAARWMELVGRQATEAAQIAAQKNARPK